MLIRAMKFWTFLGFAVACSLAAWAVADESASFRSIVTEPGALKDTDGHVQGIACSDEYYPTKTSDKRAELSFVEVTPTGKSLTSEPEAR